jgi:exosortase
MILFEQGVAIGYQTGCISVQTDNQTTAGPERTCEPTACVRADAPASAESTVGVLDQFQTDLIGFWGKLPGKAFFFTLLVAWLVLFGFFGNSTFGYVGSPSLYRWMWNSYSAREVDGSLGDDSLGMIVPWVVVGLYWWKRRQLIEAPLRDWWPGMLLVGAALALHLVGYAAQQPRASVASLFLGIYGIMGLTWGPEWLRRSFFPFFLFIFCIPFAGLILKVTFYLRLLASQIVEWIAHGVLAINVVREGVVLKDPGGKYYYEVAAACSGIRSLLTIGLMATVGAFVFLEGWWRRGVFMLAAVPLAVAGNVVRLLSIVIAADFGGQKWGDRVHEGGPMGIISLLPYAIAFVGLLGLEKVLREEQKDSEPRPV